MKNQFVFFVVLMLAFFSCGSSSKLVKENEVLSGKKIELETNQQNIKPTLADKIIWSAFKYRGVPYKYGGITKKGMDCSGLVMKSFAERKVQLPRTSFKMSLRGFKVPLKKAKRGDLIFFNTNPKSNKRVNHVGIVTHHKKGVVKFIHSSSSRGVILSTMKENYYKKHFVFVKRVL